MTIEFLTRISWLSSLPGSGIWAWLAGRFREERLKPAPSGITKTTRTCEWAGADSSQQFPFTPIFFFFCIPCQLPSLCEVLALSPLLIRHPSCSLPLQLGLHSSGVIWNRIPLSSWGIRHVCAWTCELLPFTYQHCGSFTLSFPWCDSLELVGREQWRPHPQHVMERSSV